MAEADVVAATIEAALLKLSLVRARAHQALYGHSLPNRPDATVSRAVTAAYEKLKERRRAQETEMQKLDRQIEEYESMLRLVDDDGGGPLHADFFGIEESNGAPDDSIFSDSNPVIEERTPAPTFASFTDVRIPHLIGMC